MESAAFFLAVGGRRWEGQDCPGVDVARPVECDDRDAHCGGECGCCVFRVDLVVVTCACPAMDGYE